MNAVNASSRISFLPTESITRRLKVITTEANRTASDHGEMEVVQPWDNAGVDAGSVGNIVCAEGV